MIVRDIGDRVSVGRGTTRVRNSVRYIKSWGIMEMGCPVEVVLVCTEPGYPLEAPVI